MVTELNEGGKLEKSVKTFGSVASWHGAKSDITERLFGLEWHVL